MNAWIEFWKWAYIVGLASFFVLVVAIIPLGAKDLAALFRHLGGERDTIHDESDGDN